MTASNPLSAWMYPKEWASSTAQYFNSDDEEFRTNFVKSCELRDAAIRAQAIEETLNKAILKHTGPAIVYFEGGERYNVYEPFIILKT